jgi:hypothetical protein
MIGRFAQSRETEAATHMIAHEVKRALGERSGVVGRRLAGFQPAYGEEHSIC